ITMDLSDASGASDSDEDLREAVALAGPGLFVQNERSHVCDTAGLTARLAEFSQADSLPWIERLDVLCEPAPAAVPGSELDFDPKTVDARDDFKRELLFYRLAQSAAADGLSRLKAEGVPTKRPDDYLAEMVKSDDHMARVRSNLVAKQQDLQAREKAKELRQQRKFAKQAQVEAQLKKQAEKKQFTEAIKKIKKKGVGAEDLEGMLSGKRRVGKPEGLEDTPIMHKQQQQKGGNARRSNKKRDYKNQKFGFGGQKKRSKYNTKDSARSFSGFNTAKHGATAKKAAKFKVQNQKRSKGGGGGFGKNKNKSQGRKR
ncbi:hypothetical protein BOX15_Mlig032812g3, partial [Macrostomum lignano]